MSEQISGISLRDLFRKGENIYEVIGITEQPTVSLRSVRDETVEIHLVIGSPQFQEFQQLIPKDPPTEEKWPFGR